MPGAPSLTSSWVVTGMSNAPTGQVGAELGTVSNYLHSSGLSLPINPKRAIDSTLFEGGFTPMKLDGSPETLPVDQWLPTAARRYAQLGFKVGPLNGKIPLTAHGFKDFTTDLEKVQSWWQKYPGANIGATPSKGLVVLDIDPRNGGWDTWIELTQGHQMPATLTMLTGSHGLHYWFKLPYAGALRGTAGEGVDIKTHTGYLVMPPSVHPTTGQFYLVANWCSPAVLPTWLRAHVYKPVAQPVQARRVVAGDNNPGVGLVAAVEQARKGQRNSVLYWAACRAVEEGLELTAELTRSGQSIGLADAEIVRTLSNAMGRAA